MHLRPEWLAQENATKVAFFIFMDIYIYSDESGVFDYIHNKYFVFGGLICFGEKHKEALSRKYTSIENNLKDHFEMFKDIEIKGSNCRRRTRQRIYRSFNNEFKFGVVIYEKEVLKTIFADVKTRQRYLDYAYKIVLKKLFETMMNNKAIEAYEVRNIYIYADDHITATNGIYELEESILQEFKYGIYNRTWNEFFPPILPYLKEIKVKFCDSKNTTLVRAADFIANNLYHNVRDNNGNILPDYNFFIMTLPNHKIIQTGLEYFKKT